MVDGVLMEQVEQEEQELLVEVELVQGKKEEEEHLDGQMKVL